MRLSVYKLLLLAAMVLLRSAGDACAQRPADTIRLGAIITEQGDTVAMVFLPEFVKTARLPRRYARQQARWDKLRYNVYTVYPYAVIAADVLKDVDENLARIDDKAERKKYLKSVEKELMQRFRGELENLSISQGQVLVKLISRQTGKNCFGIIQELKGGFSAVVWQSVALLFSNNLKREYDPLDRDRDIEAIVQEIELQAYYYHMYRQQQAQR
jgi:hypothetical protein